MENLIENNENTDNNSDVAKIIKPIQQLQQQQETENNLQLQQQQQQPPTQQDVQQQLQLQEQGGITKQIETPGDKTLEQQPLLPKEFEGEDDDEEEDDDDDDDDDEEKETSQKLIIDIPDEEEEDEDEDDDVIALDDLPTEVVLPPKENAEVAKNNIKKPTEAETIITLSDGEEDVPANEVVSKPGKVQKRRSVGSNAAAGTDEERFRLKRRKINVEGAPKMPLTGYVRYMNDRRESLRKEHPTKNHMEHTKMIGEEWQSLPADVKASYLKAADADKQRYVKELDIFLKSRPDVLASELAKNKARKTVENNTTTNSSTSTLTATATATTTTATAAGLTTNKQQQQQQQQQQQVLKDKSQTLDNATKSSKEGITKEKTTTKEMVAPMPSTSQQALDNHKTTQEKNKRKRTPTPPTTTTTTPPAMATNTNAASTSNATATNATTTAATSAALVTPAPGEIPIFTNEFLEHNKVYDMELRSLRKSKTDLEQQNSVLEKHVENMKFGVEKMITENNELEEKNRLLEIYLDKLKRKLALALATLPLPSAPNGATVDNIDKYMQDLYKMSTSNSHGPATLNKAKDIIRKLDLQIQL